MSPELRKLLIQGMCLLVMFIISVVYLLFFASKTPAPAIPPPSSFWDGKTYLSEKGYIITENYIPLRAIARKPNLRLFGNSTDRQAMDVVAIMEPWEPYYVFQFSPNEGRMQIGKNTTQDKYWVSYDECFCWPTRECVTVEKDMPVYASLEAAKTGNALDKAYSYRFKDHFHKTGPEANRKFYSMAALPVIERKESIYWCVLRPEGDEKGYQKCWIRYDGSNPDVTFRIRTNREEWALYLTDLYNLQNQYRNRARSEETKLDILKLSVNFMTFNPSEASGTAGRTFTQAKGILKPTGGIQNLLSNDMEYERFRDRFVKLTDFDSTLENWDMEVAYPTEDMLP